MKTWRIPVGDQLAMSIYTRADISKGMFELVRDKFGKAIRVMKCGFSYD